MSRLRDRFIDHVRLFRGRKNGSLMILSVAMYLLRPGVCPATPHQLVTGPLKPLDQRLREYGIVTSRDSLIAALMDDRAQVRILAADKLAADNDLSAAPAIRHAYDVETVPINRINMLLILGELGDTASRRELEKACAESGLGGALPMSAGEALLQLGSSACMPSTIAVLQANGDYESMSKALSLVPRYLAYGTAVERKALLEGVQKALGNASAGIRLLAADTLGTQGDRSAIAVLQRAAAAETDRSVQIVIEQSLQSLRGKTGRQTKALHAYEP